MGLALWLCDITENDLVVYIHRQEQNSVVIGSYI